MGVACAGTASHLLHPLSHNACPHTQHHVLVARTHLLFPRVCPPSPQQRPERRRQQSPLQTWLTKRDGVGYRVRPYPGTIPVGALAPPCPARPASRCDLARQWLPRPPLCTYLGNSTCVAVVAVLGATAGTLQAAAAPAARFVLPHKNQRLGGCVVKPLCLRWRSARYGTISRVPMCNHLMCCVYGCRSGRPGAVVRMQLWLCLGLVQAVILRYQPLFYAHLTYPPPSIHEQFRRAASPA